MVESKYRRACRNLEDAISSVDKANKNAERLMLDALIALNKKLLNP